MNTVHLMSYIMWCDVIKCGCDAFYSVYDAIYIVGVMSYIQRCDIIKQVGVMTQIPWLSCRIPWI